MANTLYQWLVVSVAALLHPFFVSMTDINYNDNTKSLEISVRIFTDDFENTLRKYHQDKIDILHPANQEQMNGYVRDYIQQHLQMKVNDKAVQLNFVGYEQQSESIWAYFEVNKVDKVTKVEIVNNLLHDYNTNQINMMHIKVKDNEQSDKLNYPATNAVFSF
ncbi:hypothetical protein FRZ67_00605 [Panacibacter ginsenosidivorans]|uniref:Peptidase E n=1 Tax=Panacibacter ginsenosidivorans TaxID=1813871 RepID=A0A5B8V4X8_9BACT|nr:DUF6702 family protein [Panacibacter ginsenosidivorans]QEC65873.1 hypothetical protein FRZ67_00605 [Panacibacter ginsenosidivorans]